MDSNGCGVGKEKLNEWPDTDTAEDFMDNQTGRKATSARERGAMDEGYCFGARQDGRNSRSRDPER